MQYKRSLGDRKVEQKLEKQEARMTRTAKVVKVGLRLIGNPVATSLVKADVAAVKVRLTARTALSPMETATTVESMVTESPIVANDKLIRKAAQLQCTSNSQAQ